MSCLSVTMTTTFSKSVQTCLGFHGWTWSSIVAEMVSQKMRLRKEWVSDGCFGVSLFLQLDRLQTGSLRDVDDDDDDDEWSEVVALDYKEEKKGRQSLDTYIIKGSHPKPSSSHSKPFVGPCWVADVGLTWTEIVKKRPKFLHQVSLAETFWTRDIFILKLWISRFIKAM